MVFWQHLLSFRGIFLERKKWNFYFITPIINSYATRKAKWLIIVVAELLLIVTVVYGNADMRLWFYWPFYSAGLLGSTKVLINKVNFKAILSAVIIFLGVSINSGNGIGVFSFITSGCIVVFMLNMGQILRNTVLQRSMTLISYASMCAYLYHRPFYSLTSGYLGAILTAYGMVLPALLMICCGIQFLYDKLIKADLICALGGCMVTIMNKRRKTLADGEYENT